MHDFVPGTSERDPELTLENQRHRGRYMAVADRNEALASLPGVMSRTAGWLPCIPRDRADSGIAALRFDQCREAPPALS